MQRLLKNILRFIRRCCVVRTMVHGRRVPMVGSWKVGTRNLHLLLVRVEAGGRVQVVRRLLVVPARPLHPSRALHRHHQVPRCAPGSPCHLGHSTLQVSTPRCFHFSHHKQLFEEASSSLLKTTQLSRHRSARGTERGGGGFQV